MKIHSCSLWIATAAIANGKTVTIQKTLKAKDWPIERGGFGRHVFWYSPEITFEEQRPMVVGGDVLVFDIRFDTCLKVTNAGEEVSFQIDGISNRINDGPDGWEHHVPWEWKFQMAPGVKDTSSVSDTATILAGPHVPNDMQGRCENFPVELAEQGTATVCGIELKLRIPNSVTKPWDPSRLKLQYDPLFRIHESQERRERSGKILISRLGAALNSTGTRASTITIDQRMLPPDV